MPKDHAALRAHEIKSWLERSQLQVRNWISLDDMPLELMAPSIMRGHFVHTHPKEGLTPEKVKLAISILTSEEKNETSI